MVRKNQTIGFIGFVRRLADYRMRHGFGLDDGSLSQYFPPGQEVEDLRAGVLDGMGDPRGNEDQGAVSGDKPLLDLTGVHFPDKDADAVERVEPLGMAGMVVVTPAITWADGNQVEGFAQVLGCLEPTLPGKVAHPPGVGVNLCAKIDKLHGYHLDSLGAAEVSPKNC
jgi:hypothetical protein